LLESPEEQSRLLCEVPKVIADEIEPEATPQGTPEEVKQGNSGSPRSILSGASEIPIHVIAATGTASTWMSHSTDYAGASYRFISFFPLKCLPKIWFKSFNLYATNHMHIFAMLMSVYWFSFGEKGGELVFNMDYQN
jgi:hypothetical protein